MNTRLRVNGTPPVTVKSKFPHCTRFISATFGYKISDPLKAMMLFGLPDSIITSRAQAAIANHTDETKVLEDLRKSFDSSIGIDIDFIKFVEDVEIKTYRLLNSNSWITSGHEPMDNGLSIKKY